MKLNSSKYKGNPAMALLLNPLQIPDNGLFRDVQLIKRCPLFLAFDAVLP